MKPQGRTEEPMRRAFVDLHIHSLYSDGTHSPERLCEMVQETGLTHVALCDHDTLAGIGAMRDAMDAMNRRRRDEQCSGMYGSPYAEASDFVFLPGVELSAGPGGRIHVLGYGAGQSGAELESALDNARQRRRERFGEMVEKLTQMGVEIPPTLLPEATHATPGRAHIARALVKMGAVSTMKQAFDRFLGEGKPAYVPYQRMSAAEAVQLLRRAHAVPVVAHPCRTFAREQPLFEMLGALQDEGLMGVEVFHPSASHRDIQALEAFTRRRGLLVTGGSDFHGDKGSAALGKLPAGWTDMAKDVDILISSTALA